VPRSTARKLLIESIPSGYFCLENLLVYHYRRLKSDRLLGPLADRIQPIFITVDPQRDTAPVLAQYVKAFDPRLLGLTGSAAQIAATAQAFHVFYKVRDLGNGESTIDHSSYIYLIDPAGRVAKLLTGSLPGHPMAAELERLVK
jgi:protein SCO1